MALSPGTRLGPYEIESVLGVGGMGEVYRARDTRLERTVAIKVLNSQLVGSAELSARFEREARAISQLNHPHICSLFDIGHQDATDYLVMEFLEGETLAERLRQGPLPLNKVLQIAIAIADALEQAHRVGIVHRDLKPGNVMLTPTGTKLLDFGLAKTAAVAALAGAGSAPLLSAAMTMSSPSPQSPLTSSGTLIGTVQYMSPEQLQGTEADARSDIFAFGATLYEMIVGQRAFQGKSQIKVASAILEDEPMPVHSFRRGIPPALDQLIMSCLAKSPDQRFQCVHDVKLQLQMIAEAPPELAAAQPRYKLPERVSWIVAGVALAVALLAVLVPLRVATKPGPVVRATILPPEKANFLFIGPTSGLPAISPDGSKIAYVAHRAEAEQMLWVRPIGAFAEQPLAGTEGASFPFWSPDSRYIGFFADGKLKKIEANGGPAEVVAVAAAGRGGAWNQDGTIVFAPGAVGPLLRVSAAGGQPAEATKLALGQNGHRFPSFLPDGKHFLFYAVGTAGALNVPTIGIGVAGGVYVGSLIGDLPPEGKLLFSNEWNAIYSPPGYLLYVRENTLLARPFNVRRFQFTGEAFPVAEHVSSNGGFWESMFSASQNGILAYVRGERIFGGPQLTWFERSGKQLAQLATPGSLSPKLSPDGSRVAYSARDNSGNSDIWVYDLKRNVPIRLTFEPSAELNPIWSPDGRTIYFSSNRKGAFTLFRKPATGMGPEEQILEDPTAACYVQSISPDGKFLAYTRLDLKNSGKWEVWMLPLTSDRKPFPFLRSSFSINHPQFSPDGKWVAYSSNESGQPDVYVTPFPHVDAKWMVSTGGGTQPRWRKDGRELFYYDISGRLMAVNVSSRVNDFQASVPQQVMRIASTGGPLWMYDVSADAKRFLVVSGQVAGTPEPISLVVNWMTELKR